MRLLQSGSLLPLLMILLAGPAPRSAPAAQYDWWEGAPNGHWDDPNSWLPYGVPGSGSNLFIYSRYGAALSPQYRSATAPAHQSLKLDRPSGTGSVVFRQAQDTLKCNSVTLGVYGPASWIHSGGRAEFGLLRLGEWSGSTGTFHLQNSGQLLTTDTEVGSAGTGVFNLSTGASHSNANHIWITDGSSYNMSGGTLTTDSMTLDADFRQLAGQTTVTGELKVQLGPVPPAGKAYLENGQLTVGTLNLQYGTYEQQGGVLSAGTVSNGAASLFNLVNGQCSAGSFTNNGFAGQTGGTTTLQTHLTNADGATFQQSGGVWICQTLTNHSNHATIMNTAECRARDLVNNNALQLQGGILRGPQAMPGLFWICSLDNNGNFTMSGGEFMGELTNDGTFSYSAGSFASSRLINNGTFSRNVPFECRQMVNNASLTADATRPILLTGAGYPSALENTGTLTVSDTAITVNGDAPIANTGTLRGSGTLQSDVQNSGKLTVGISVFAATLTVEGDYTQDADGRLELTAYEGIGVGAVTDKLIVGGIAHLAGTLSVTGSSYVPNAGDRLRVLSYTGYQGDFDVWSLPSLPAGRVWLREQTATSLALVMASPVPPDFDADADVDLDDFGRFQACLTGPALGPPAAGCASADFDADHDVDQTDFGLFQRCISGAGRPAEAGCTGP